MTSEIESQLRQVGCVDLATFRRLFWIMAPVSNVPTEGAAWTLNEVHKLDGNWNYFSAYLQYPYWMVNLVVLYCHENTAGVADIKTVSKGLRKISWGLVPAWLDI